LFFYKKKTFFFVFYLIYLICFLKNNILVLVFFFEFIRTFLSYSKIFRVIFVFLLVLGETLTFFGSLRGAIDTIGNLGGTLTIKW
jgi:hypothetical protein